VGDAVEDPGCQAAHLDAAPRCRGPAGPTARDRALALARAAIIVAGVRRFAPERQGDEDVSVAGGGVALGRRGVDALLDDVQANASLAELRAEGDEVQDRAPEPIQARDLQRVTVAGLRVPAAVPVG